MRLLHYIEIQNFKHFGDKQRIDLDHPAVLIGPNNCGKTTAIQAIALWSQAVKTWFDVKGKSPPKERKATSLNRLSIVSVPVQRTRYFWHNAAVRTGRRDIPLLITVGILHGNTVKPVTMRFRNQGNDLVYCTPDDTSPDALEIIEAAAALDVALLYPMSGLEIEERILQPGSIDVSLGQGQTAQVLRNLCLLVFKNAPQDWRLITEMMSRLFSVDLNEPAETTRGTIDLFYQQENAKELLDVSHAGRGFQQMLLIFAYLYWRRRSVLLIDEPDAHLEILRQKQVYVLLREIAEENESQVVLATHSEVILDEALGRNLTLLLRGRADNLAAKSGIRDALKNYGTEHYIRALERGYVLYVEGGTDIDVLRALARRLAHPVASAWDPKINAHYVADNYPESNLDAELERVEGGFGGKPQEHFFALLGMVPGLQGLAILDSDGRPLSDFKKGGLHVVYWKRYEIENYFITPEVLRMQVDEHYKKESPPSADDIRSKAEEVLDALILERVFGGREEELAIWKAVDADAARLIWEATTERERVKLSDFAEEFFRRLAARLGHAMLLRKAELHWLVRFVEPSSIPSEVGEKLDLLKRLFDQANSGEGRGSA